MDTTKAYEKYGKAKQQRAAGTQILGRTLHSGRAYPFKVLFLTLWGGRWGGVLNSFLRSFDVCGSLFLWRNDPRPHRLCGLGKVYGIVDWPVRLPVGRSEGE